MIAEYLELQKLKFPPYVIITSVYRNQKNSYHKKNNAIDFLPIWKNYPKKVSQNKLDLMLLKYLYENHNGGLGFNPKGKCRHIHLDTGFKSKWKEITIDNKKNCVNNHKIEYLDLNVNYDKTFLNYLVPIEMSIDISNNKSTLDSIKEKYNYVNTNLNILLLLLIFFIIILNNYVRKK